MWILIHARFVINGNDISYWACMINYEDQTQMLLISFRLLVLFIPELRNKEKLPNLNQMYDDVIKWKFFPRYCLFVHKGQWRGDLLFSLIWASINRWVNNCEAGVCSLWRHCNVKDMVGSRNGVPVRATLIMSIPWGWNNHPVRNSITCRDEIASIHGK